MTVRRWWRPEDKTTLLLDEFVDNNQPENDAAALGEDNAALGEDNAVLGEDNAVLGEDNATAQVREPGQVR